MTADLLRRAADLIEQRAARATPGPWRTADVEGIFYIASANCGPVTMHNDGPVCSCPFDDSDEGVAIERTEAEGGRADAEWMTALSPSVAAPLAAWLRAEADRLDIKASGWHPAYLDALAATLERQHGPAFELARSILGEQP